MNTINCRIKLNDFQDAPGRQVTPAEALVLRFLHDPASANLARTAPPAEQSAHWRFITNAAPAGTVSHSDAEELQRLRGKYLVRARSGAPGSHLLDDLFPGLNPKLPQTFKEIGLDVDLARAEPAKAHGAQLARTTNHVVEDLKAQVEDLKQQLAETNRKNRRPPKATEADSEPAE